MKKAGIAPLKKAGGLNAKKAGALAPKKAGTNKAGAVLVPRDFIVAQQTLHQMIDMYGDIAPLQVMPKNPTLRSEINEAIAMQDILKLQQLYAKQTARFKQEVHKPGGRDPALVFAASLGAQPIVLFLLEIGVDPNQADESGQTALHTASGGGYEGLVGVLVKRGACAWLNDIAGNSPFLLAATKGLEAVLLELVRFGVNPWERDSTDRMEMDYILDSELRKRVAELAYWLRRRAFLLVLPLSPVSRLSFNLHHLIAQYL